MKKTAIKKMELPRFYNKVRSITRKLRASIKPSRKMYIYGSVRQESNLCSAIKFEMLRENFTRILFIIDNETGDYLLAVEKKFPRRR